MPELPRKPGLPLEEKAQIEPAAEAPSPRASHPSSGETDPQGEAAPPAMPAPAASLPPTADDSLPIPPARDDATPMAEVEEPAPAPLPDAGEAAAIGAMSAAEEAVRRRAEADYQRAIDDAIRAAQWRTDDAVYVGLVDELVRLRGPGGVESGSPSSAARAAGGDDAPWSAPARAPGAGAWGSDGSAAYGAFDEADASGGGPRPRPAVYGSDDERVRAEQVQGRAGGGNRIRGPGGRPISNAEFWRIRDYERYVKIIRTYNKKYQEIGPRDYIPTQADVARVERLANRMLDAVAFFKARDISLTNHGVMRFGQRETRAEFEQALRAYNTGRLYYDPLHNLFIRYDNQTGVYVAVTAPRGGKIHSVVQGDPLTRWRPVPYQ